MKSNEEIKINPIKRLWLCVGNNGYCDFETLSYKKTDSIKKLIKGTRWSWVRWKSKGWKCVKVDIDFKISNK